MMKDYKSLALQIILQIGGKENITAAWHCVTRLRFNVKEKEQVKIDAIKSLPDVMGAQFSGDQFQVIIGNDVSKVYSEVEKQLGNLAEVASEQTQKGGIISRLMDTISGIFTPVLPALVGTGLLKGFLALGVALDWASVDSTGYSLLFMVSDCAFYFLPFLLAVSSARRFKTNEYLALCLAGTLLYPTMVDGYNAIVAGGDVVSMNLFGVIPIPFLAYSSSVIPIILATWCLKYVYDFVKKWMPSLLTTMFTPMITLLIVVPLTLIIFGPIGTYIGTGLGQILFWLFENVGILAGALVGACYPLLVMTGMHWALMPIMLESFNKLGYDQTLSPAMLAATFAMAGATFGVFAKVKNSEMKQLSLSTGISALLGITEPAMYGVVLKLRRPFYAAMAGGAIAGALLNLFKIKNFGMSMPGLIALAGYVDSENQMNIIISALGSVIAFIVAAVVTYFLGFAEDDSVVKEPEKARVKSSATNETNTPLKIQAPVSGAIIPVESLSDQTFAQEIMGKTYAIQPEDGQIDSPVKGTVEMIATTKHAIGIKSDEGVEILIHIGIDTVELQGKGFEVQVKEGEEIQIGTPLIKVDLDLLKHAGYDPVVMTIITNSNDFLDILPVYQKEELQVGNDLSVAVN